MSYFNLFYNSIGEFNHDVQNVIALFHAWSLIVYINQSPSKTFGQYNFTTTHFSIFFWAFEPCIT
jgi:hypothetical protein